MRVHIAVVVAVALALFFHGRWLDGQRGDELTKACERTNVLRGVVHGFLNEAATARAKEGHSIVARNYRNLMWRLEAVPHTPPGSARVACGEAYR